MLDELMNEVFETCPHCKGAGCITNPNWEEYWDEYMKVKHSIKETKIGEVELILAENGIYPPEDEPEEIECWVCNGTGRVLTNKGKAFISLLKAYLQT